jgi:hypothetical protein
MAADRPVIEMTKVLPIEMPFEAIFVRGYDAGYQIGWIHGRDDERTAWNGIIGAYADTIAQPTQDERNGVHGDGQPCATRCRRCSRCTRYAAAWRNRRDFCADDYPGGPVAWESPAA